MQLSPGFIFKTISIVYDIQKGQQRIYDLPVAAVSPNGKFALSLNFSRLAKMRPGYGYEGLIDKWENVMAQVDDGIYLIDLATGKHKLIISVAQIADINSDNINFSILNKAYWFFREIISTPYNLIKYIFHNLRI